MADSDSAPSPPIAPLSAKNENLIPVSSKIADLNESRAELLTRIQGLKKDMQEWRLKLDTQVKVYHDRGRHAQPNRHTFHYDTRNTIGSVLAVLGAAPRVFDSNALNHMTIDKLRFTSLRPTRNNAGILTVRDQLTTSASGKEITELKKTLNVEVEQLRSEFQELRTTLQQQQDDVTTNLNNLKGVQEQGNTRQDQEADSTISTIDKKDAASEVES